MLFKYQEFGTSGVAGKTWVVRVIGHNFAWLPGKDIEQLSRGLCSTLLNCIQNHGWERGRECWTDYALHCYTAWLLPWYSSLL